MADWSEFAVEYEPLTVKCLFDFLCGKVSPEMAKSIINHLDCLTTVKSDLIETIEKENFARFDSLLRENGIDYDISARIMAYLTEQERYKLNGQEGVVDINTIDENTTDEEDEHQLMLMQRFTKEHIMDYCRKEALEEEYIEANAATFDRYYNAINKAYSQEKFVKGTVRECYFYFINLCNDIISYYNEECLTESETEMLTHFAETKIANFPAVKVYFKSFTKGKFISEGFEIIDNEKFAKAEKMLVKEVKANSPLPSIPRKKEFALPTKLDVMSEYGRASRLFEKAITKGLIEEDEDKPMNLYGRTMGQNVCLAKV